jgi:hypothetical protein
MGMDLSEIFRAQHGPDKVNQQSGGNGGAENKVQHHTRSQAGTYRISSAKMAAPNKRVMTSPMKGLLSKPPL